MAKRSKAETERFYRRLLAEQRRSGLSIRAFARARGVPAGTLSFWGHELRKRDMAARRDRRKRAAKSEFVPVSIVDAAGVVASAMAGSPAESKPAGGGYEIELGSGRVLRVPADFDEGRVAALVRAVASC